MDKSAPLMPWIIQAASEQERNIDASSVIISCRYVRDSRRFRGTQCLDMSLTCNATILRDGDLSISLGASFLDVLLDDSECVHWSFLRLVCLIPFLQIHFSFS